MFNQGAGSQISGKSFWDRVISKKFYAHDEQNSARVGDVVRIKESRPLSKLKRWTLEEVIRRSSLPQAEEIAQPAV